MAFTALDYYQIEDLLTDEERMIRDTVREFVTDNLMPIIQDCNSNARFPMELVAMAGELGLLGAPYPEKYGCADLGPRRKRPLSRAVTTRARTPRKRRSGRQQASSPLAAGTSRPGRAWAPC